MSSKKSSYLSQMYNSEAAPEKVNQVSSQLLNEINQDLNDHFESQEQQKQEYSLEIDSDTTPFLSFFSSDEQNDSHRCQEFNINMTFRHRLYRFYRQYCPEKNNQLGMMVNKYKWKEEVLFKNLEKKYGLEPEMSDNDYYTIRKRIEYQNKVQAAKKSINPIFDGHRLDEDTLILLARIVVDTQEGGSLSENLLELI
jgi:hypothetical protein